MRLNVHMYEGICRCCWPINCIRLQIACHKFQLNCHYCCFVVFVAALVVWAYKVIITFCEHTHTHTHTRAHMYIFMGVLSHIHTRMYMHLYACILLWVQMIDLCGIGLRCTLWWLASDRQNDCFVHVIFIFYELNIAIKL